MNEPPPSFGTITPDDFRRIREVFESALERSPAERTPLIKQACGGNTLLITEVERMLAADAERNPLLDGGVDRFRVGATFANHFQIIGNLGRGGMGEVYRGRDKNLNRDVALKILPETFAFDPDRLARFKREAQVLASFNHPNIGAIYGFEEANSVQALVLELVEGPTLADRIAQGPVPVEEAVPIARQIAEALEAAHEQGIIHRDLKPANVKLRADGVVKVLDFGLAKALQPVGITRADGTDSPAITSPAMIDMGVIFGTPAYMAPEQAKRGAVDRRVDIWAFGAVLYEMLSGRRAFRGEDTSETLASVLRQEIDWTALPASTPAPLRALIGRCLDRDVRRRLRDIGEARIVLDDPTEKVDALARPLPLWRRAIPVVLAIVLTSALAGTAAWYLYRGSSPRLAVTRFLFTLPQGQALALPSTGHMIALSPDGSHMVYGADSRLYLRSMSALDVRAIQGTEGYDAVTDPVFSPDGLSVAFYARSDQTIKTIPVSGGAAVTIGRAGIPYGISWGPDGIVIGQGSQGIMRVSPNGGKPEVLLRVNDDEEAHGPHVLPGGQHVLFTVATGTARDRWNRARVVVQSLKSGQRNTLVEGGSDARYVPTGHVLYALRASVFAIPFDVRRLQATGSPVPVIEGVRRTAGGHTGAAQFSISSTGSLIYVAGPDYLWDARWIIALIDRKGGIEPLKLPPGPLSSPRVSPDGTRIAFAPEDDKEAIVWIYNLSGTGAVQRLTFRGNNRFPIWSSDSKRVAFQSDRDGDLAIFWQPADGTGSAERLTKPDQGTSHVPESWSPNGDWLLYSVIKGSDMSLWTLSLKDRKATAFGDVHSSFPTGARFSPDGKWVAYTSAERAATTIYVQPFPATGAKYQLFVKGSNNIPHKVAWSPDGKELFYVPRFGGFEAVSVTTRPAFAFGNAVAVPRPFQPGSPNLRTLYDITPGGKFVGLIDTKQSGPLTPPQEIAVVLNWFEDLRARVPVAR